MPAGRLAFECTGAAAWELVAAVLAGLRGQLCLLLLPLFPVAAQQGTDVLVGAVGYTGSGASTVQGFQLFALADGEPHLNPLDTERSVS